MLELFLPLIIVGTAIWAAIDASGLLAEKNLAKGPGGYSPAEWFFAVMLLWIVGFPLYLIRRGEAKRRDRLTPEERQRDLQAIASRRSPGAFLLGVLLMATGLIGGLVALGADHRFGQLLALIAIAVGSWVIWRKR